MRLSEICHDRYHRYVPFDGRMKTVNIGRTCSQTEENHCTMVRQILKASRLEGLPRPTATRSLWACRRLVDTQRLELARGET